MSKLPNYASVFSSLFRPLFSVYRSAFAAAKRLNGFLPQFKRPIPEDVTDSEDDIKARNPNVTAYTAFKRNSTFIKCLFIMKNHFNIKTQRLVCFYLQAYTPHKDKRGQAKVCIG